MIMHHLIVAAINQINGKRIVYDLCIQFVIYFLPVLWSCE